MRIEWTEQALSDLDDAFFYIDDRNPDAAHRFFRGMFESVKELMTFPEMGPPVYDLDPPGLYRQLVRGHHRVFYRVEGDVVLVMRVWDARRNPSSFDVTE
jgi:plasmid stabilization system protein ParE